MEIRRTANAGVLLKLDGISILMDGVCREVKPYPATPPEEREALQRSWPDVVAFTHAHEDHYDPDYAAAYQKQTGGVILGPGDLPGCESTMDAMTLGGVTVTPIPSRHIGAAGKLLSHTSFLIRGSRTVLFMGDASPLQWKAKGDLTKPDVLIAPYAYANSLSGWSVTKFLAPGAVVLLHMPARELDEAGLWPAVETVIRQADPVHITIPKLGEVLHF